MVLNIVLMTIGIAMMIESIILLLFPNWATKTVKRLTKNVKIVKKILTIELIVAIIIFIIGMNI